MVSVRMASTRTVSGECGNEENKQGIDLSDGVTNVYISGREFEDIYPVWDWRRLPGTIEAQAPMAHPGTGDAACEAFYRDLKAKHRTAFVGGASDGSVGIAVADYRSRGEMSVRRTWFMFDGVVIVANRGATTQTARHPASTSLDQRLVDGNATYALRTEAAPFVTPPIPLREGSEAALATTSLAWLHHSHIGYVPLPTPRMVGTNGDTLSEYTIRASLENMTGSWENITQGDAHPVTMAVFTAFIDHGTHDHPVDISSTYAIVPGVPVTAMSEVLDELDTHLRVQSGWNASVACWVGDAATTMMAALWHPNVSGKASSAGCWDVMLVSVEPTLPRGDRSQAQACTGATPPATDMHCDLHHSTALSSVPSVNSTDCAAKCCAVPRCSCWTWTSDERGKGAYCMLKASSAPLVPAKGLGAYVCLM